ncbi:NAD-dependent epimerase [Thiotrichales bacterium 19S11-10]|nr:NAD-dependent epimerase [Thiotrichales bacterium 19S11-10]MCF6806843.1 NAD-dependent epimerase [Thiotrichales bacterium 19S9-11]MCF6810812.1 NAD-dependent epimerase [Thiotrichales bacterium 19S9-12]
MVLLVTGCCGFIGFHLTLKRLSQGDTVIGLDNLNDYYDVDLKKARLRKLEAFDNFTFEKIDLADKEKMADLFKRYQFEKICHLAAQAGVRYSIKNPMSYIDSNLTGFTNILEGARYYHIEHLVYASTSSVYGANTNQPFTETKGADHPMSLYAATKKANELMAHSYANLYQLPSTGLRFFTVYGPWGRPDMALFLFTKNILLDKPIDVFNYGKMLRDFTYIDDIVEGVSRAIDKKAQSDSNWDSDNPNPATSYAPYRIYNIGNNKPVELMDYIHAIEKATNKKAQLNLMPMQDGDVPSTCADTSLLESDLGYKPKISVEEGVAHFVAWYRNYYQL